MPRKLRYEVADPAEVQVFHAVQRCVRREFLCGGDRFTRQSFEHRRSWFRVRLEFLASVFRTDCLTYTVLSNYLHLVLGKQPEVLAERRRRLPDVSWWMRCTAENTLDMQTAKTPETSVFMGANDRRDDLAEC